MLVQATGLQVGEPKSAFVYAAHVHRLGRAILVLRAKVVLTGNSVYVAARVVTHFDQQRVIGRMMRERDDGVVGGLAATVHVERHEGHVALVVHGVRPTLEHERT